MATATVTATNGASVRKGPGTGYSSFGTLGYQKTVDVLGTTNGWHKINYNQQTGYIAKDETTTLSGSSGGGLLASTLTKVFNAAKSVASAVAGMSSDSGNSGGSSESQSSKTYTVTASALNVRSGAGTNYGVLGIIYNGHSVTALDETDNWVKMAYNSGTGWVSKKYLKETTNSSGGGSDSGAPSNAKTGKVTATALNVRRGAGMSYGIIGILNHGDAVSYTEEYNGWLKIAYGSGYGWVSKKYIEINGGSDSGGSGGGSDSGSPSTPQSGKVTTTALNVRNGAGTNYSIIGILYDGDTFSYVQETSGWLKIAYGTGYGWISKKYTDVGGGTSSGGSGGSGNVSADKMKEAGQKAANRANTLYSQYRADGWTYSRDERSSTGHYDCSSFCHRCWTAGGVDFGWANSEGEALKCNEAGGTVSSTQNIMPGDLLIYPTNWNSGTRWKGINHVAIAVSSSERVDAGGTPVKKYGLGSPVYIGRPGYLL